MRLIDHPILLIWSGKTTILALVLIMACTATLLAAQSGPQSGSGRDPFENGGLILRGGGVEGQMPAMRLGTDIHAVVSGNIARVTVTQAFRNTSDDWMEATYLYPLPDQGAVDSLNMVIGERIFRGRIKEREEARQIYETALREGRQAGLVEQARPNMFRSNVANVGPGETVLIAIEFQAPVRQLGADYALRLPLVVGPRYVPESTLVNDRGQLRAEGLADAANVTAPILDPSLGAGINPVSITIELDPGFVPARVTSLYHEVDVSQSATTRTITLADGEVPADRDFELRWRSASDAPAIGLFRQNFDGLDYVMATITPPARADQNIIPPREMIFVIDNSGSMSGTSMIAARTSLLYALGTLRPQDRFNIIRFDDTMSQLFDQPVAASEAQLDIGRRFTSRIEARGGTEMLPALQAALDDNASLDDGRVRQVIFLTDGSLSNEAAMMEEIIANRGRSRVFMVGMGSAPNNYLMRRMAEAGRGTYANISLGIEAQTEMRRFLDRLSAPVAHDLSVEVSGGALEFSPADLPDLYVGEPLVLIGRAADVGGTLTVHGMLAGQRWSTTVNLDQATQSDAIARMWARRKVGEIEAQRWSREMHRDDAAAAIAAIGMEFHLVTSETSLIAEDDTPRRPQGAHLVREELPLLLPHGWDFDALFGRSGDGQAGSADANEAQQADLLKLPQTATLYAASLRSGLLILLLGLAGLALLRRRRKASV